jgi:hypothetical protein
MCHAARVNCGAKRCNCGAAKQKSVAEKQTGVAERGKALIGQPRISPLYFFSVFPYEILHKFLGRNDDRN